MFKQKETALQNIAFIAIMSSINVIVITIATLLPISAVFIILLLPFLSASVYISCKANFYPIYAIASVGVAMAATFYNNEMTLFYLLPSIFSGFIFGLFIKKNINSFLSVVLAALFQTFISFGIVYLINFIYKVDLINQILTLFKLDTKENAKIIVLSFFFLISLIQELLSYIILKNELQKFIHFEENNDLKLITYIGLGISIMVVPFIFISLQFAYLFMFISLLMSLYILINVITRKNLFNIIIYSLMFVIGFLLMSFLFNNIKIPYVFLLINISNILIFIYTFIYNLIEEKRNVRIS